MMTSGLRVTKITISILIIFLIFPVIGSAQQSSDAQPEFFTSLDYRRLPEGNWQFGATYNHKSLSKLVTGADAVDDDTRSRLTRGVIFRIGYGLSEKIALRLVQNYVQQSFEIRLPTVGREYLKTRGLGDTFLLTEYGIKLWSLPEGNKLSVGGGIKIPTGETDYTSDEILIREDMQPGTGSWDFLVWGNTIRRLTTNSPGYFYFEAGYRLNGESDVIDYSNELFGALGLMILPEYVGRFSGYLRFSSMGKFKDKRGTVIPNTGGEWMTIVGDVKADITDELFGRLTLEMPVKHDLEGTQLTTDYIISLSFQYTMLN